MTSINLTCCPSISDIGVIALAAGCHQLTSINLSYCDSISDIGVSALAEGCPHLTSIVRVNLTRGRDVFPQFITGVRYDPDVALFQI